jgi:hydroxymethylpyrimidine/phosphomethylpyrimidine kinase
MKTSLLPAEDAPETVDLSGAAPGDETTTRNELDPPCVLVFNASDPSGAGGLACDAVAIASVGAHMLPVVTGAYARDTAEIFDHFPFDEDAVAEQARTILEDVEVQLIKVGFVGTPENLGAIAETASDYSDVPVIAYMPNLSWWEEPQIEAYHDAFRELLLPQTTVLVGNHSTLWRWLLPDWSGERAPSARDIAKAAGELGVPYTLVTGLVLPDQYIDNVLASPNAVLANEKFERVEAVFAGAGDTLSAALAALLASGADLVAATGEALAYMDRCLDAGFRPGMGHVLPDRLFWAQTDDTGDEPNGTDPAPDPNDFALPPHETRH